MAGNQSAPKGFEMHRLKIQFLLSTLLVEWKKKHRIICPYEINVKEFDTAFSTCTQSDTPSTPPSSLLLPF
jgi:hypothetical protein